MRVHFCQKHRRLYHTFIRMHHTKKCLLPYDTKAYAHTTLIVCIHTFASYDAYVGIVWYHTLESYGIIRQSACYHTTQKRTAYACNRMRVIRQLPYAHTKKLTIRGCTYDWRAQHTIGFTIRLFHHTPLFIIRIFERSYAIIYHTIYTISHTMFA